MLYDPADFCGLTLRRVLLTLAVLDRELGLPHCYIVLHLKQSVEVGQYIWEGEVTVTGR